MRYSFLLAVFASLQTQGVDEPTASATLDAAVRSLPGFNWKDEPKPIDDEAFLKRLLKDLLGAAPTEADIKAFVSDPDRQKRSALIARLVEDDRFAPFWAGRFAGVFFGDPAKLEFTEIEDRPRGIEAQVLKRFADWLALKLKKDVPWNDIVRDMLEARGTTDGSPELAYLLSFYRRKGLAIEFPVGVARHFLGIRLSCARCHDHPFDKWRAEDYYGLSAFVIRQKVRKVGDAIELKYADEGEARMPLIYGTKEADVRLARGGVVQPTFLFGGSAEKNDDQMKVLAGFLTGKQDSQFTRAWVNRVWGWLFGYGIVDPVDDFNLKNKALSSALLEALVRDTRDQNHSLKRLIRVICNTAGYQMPGPEELPQAATFRHAAMRRVQRGSYAAPGKSALGLPITFDVPPEWTRMSARDGARATYVIPDKADKSRSAELGLFSGKLDSTKLDPLKNRFEDRKPKVKETVLEGKIRVTLTELSGIFCCDRMLEAPADYLILFAGFEAPDGKSYHFRLQGPPESVGGWREEYLSVLKSVGK